MKSSSHCAGDISGAYKPVASKNMEPVLLQNILLDSAALTISSYTHGASELRATLQI